MKQNPVLFNRKRHVAFYATSHISEQQVLQSLTQMTMHFTHALGMCTMQCNLVTLKHLFKLQGHFVKLK